jgi:predicted membrane GTPase involved in stress response
MSEALPLSVVVRPKGPAFLKAFAASAQSALNALARVATSEGPDGLLIEGLWEPDIESAIDTLKGALSVELECSKLKIHFIEGQRLLEPYLKLRIAVPEDFLGNVMGDINRRRGVVMASQDGDECKILEVDAPLSELIGYQTILRKLSLGRATVTAELAGYHEARPPPSDPNGPNAAAMRA